MDITSLIPEFGSGLLTVLAFIVALSVIVAIHEYGHYIVGRWSGIGADVFSIGFGPVLWSRVDKRGTKWQIAALPFGGYVKFKGDANAASGKDEEAMSEMTPEERRATMHGAPLWARSATVAAGPVFNFILSILVFGAVFLFQGQASEQLAVGGFRDMDLETYDIQVGDRILAIDGVSVPLLGEVEAYESFVKNLPRQSPLEYKVDREGNEMIVDGPVLYPPFVTGLAPQSAAYNAGLELGDVITSLDNKPITVFAELKEIVEASDGRALPMQVRRDGEQLDFTLVPRRVDEPQADGGFVTHWRIGVAGGLIFEPAMEAVGPGKALTGGVLQTYAIVRGSISGIYHMVTGAISSCNLSGPIGIAQTGGAMASQGAQSFIWFIAVLSTAVGLLNLFPIPMLDGGHLVFYGFEAIAGRPPSDKVMNWLMTGGLFIVLSIMVFGVTNDLFCP